MAHLQTGNHLPRSCVLLAAALACSATFASPPDGQFSRADAQAAAQVLIDSVESDYDCKFSLDYLIVGLELNTGQYTVVVQRAGKECDEALRALQLRSIAFPLDFIELGAFDELPGQELAPKGSNKDLIVEENPRDAT